MATVTVEIDREVITEAAQMVCYWNSEEVLNRINMGEGFTLAALFDALHEHATADHIIREVWEGETEGESTFGGRSAEMGAPACGVAKNTTSHSRSEGVSGSSKASSVTPRRAGKSSTTGRPAF